MSNWCYCHFQYCWTSTNMHWHSILPVTGNCWKSAIQQ